MIQRCYNLNDKAYKDYGGRGISVCERWHIFENFYENVGNPPKGKSLDRYPDNDGNYELLNFRWATSKEQNNNRRPMSCGPFKQRWFRAWHKDLMIQYLSNNQNKFAHKYGLCKQCISACLNKKRKQHKGWRFEFLKVAI